MESNAGVTERFDSQKAIVVMGMPVPPQIEDYHLMQQATAESIGKEKRTWFKGLYLLKGEGKWVIADHTVELSSGIWFLDGPMDLEEAYRKVPFLFPPCFRPIEEGE